MINKTIKFMKYCLLFLFIGFHHLLSAQAISLRWGQTLPSTNHVSLRYEHWTNGTINFSLGGFFERSRERQLNYSCYGADLLAEFASSREGFTAGAFGLRYGFGATALIENEPWIYKDWAWSKRISFGLLAEVAGEWFLTDNFTLRAGLQQKALLHSSLGHYRFQGSLGLAWRLNTY
jgi:hypothetical protein